MNRKTSHSYHSQRTNQNRIRNKTDPDTTNHVAGSCAFTWFKIRFFLCAVFISSFALCDKLGYPFFTLDTDMVYEQIQENYHYTNLKKYVMMMADSEYISNEKDSLK